ncbi:DUF1444 family protein [Lysobacter hankyongensis]|uniref:DUF1444 family protein n=1 Tax=Lysobacter hankyongensis TaxID=1176535 RepID=A0ABP9BSP1_9GAMM
MQRFFSALRALFGGARPVPAMTRAEFTDEVARRVRVAVPEIEVKVVGELELAIDMTDEGGNRAFLHNAYQMYQGESPKRRDDLIDRFVASFAEAAKGLERSPEAIIPVVKDRAWLVEIETSMRQMGGEGQDKVYEHLNDDLVVVYAIDTPSNIAYLSPEELARLGVERDALRALAVRNLRGLLPGIEVQRGEKLNMITADGNYEASLLLFSDLWEREREKLRGDPVAAVPARDLLLFADAADADAVAQLRQLATKMREEAAYSLTDRLFVLRDGQWLPF